MRRPDDSRRGFTLLEVVLAVALAVVLTGAVYAFYQVTLDAREDVRREGQLVLAQRRALDLMASELESAIVYQMLQMGLRGSSEEVTLLRTAVPSRAVFYVPQLLSFPDEWADSPASEGPAWEPEHDIVMVGYRLSRYQDEDGVERIGGLERTSMRTISAQLSEERGGEPGEPGAGPPRDEREEADAPGISNVKVSLLTEHVKFLNLRYWDGAAWVEAWDQPELPLAVMIEIGAEPLPEDLTPEEYPYETSYRVVALPVGYMPQDVSVFRDRGSGALGGGAARGGGAGARGGRGARGGAGPGGRGGGR